MADSATARRESQRIRRPWCCSFGVLPKSPDNFTTNSSSSKPHLDKLSQHSSFPSSPQIHQINHRTALGRVSRMDPRRILSPGRVSPIDSDPLPSVVLPESHNANDTETQNDNANRNVVVGDSVLVQDEIKNDVVLGGGGVYDVRLCLRGKKGGSLVLELDSEVLSRSSSVFKELIAECRKKEGGVVNFCRIEVPEVENLGVFHETIELMFEEDASRRIRNMGVSRSIDVLEVAAGIMFTKGVMSCLKYIEAVPWTENEEEKLRSFFTRFTFDDATTRDVLARLSLPEQMNSDQQLALQLVRSVTSGSNSNSRSELKSFVKDLFAKSSVYEKDLAVLNKEDLYVVCHSCLGSLLALFKEASDSLPEEKSTGVHTTKPLVERISKQADSINWLLEILLEQQMAEEFVDVWANQKDLLSLHEKVSPMIRYEISRISAWVFVALGRGKLHCRSETRCRVLQTWFMPMLLDFGWLQRCRKGLDIKVLEEAMGQALLTLPLKNQHLLFMEWFSCFSRQGAECPNLGKAFQIWWRRSSKSFEAIGVDSR